MNQPQAFAAAGRQGQPTGAYGVIQEDELHMTGMSSQDHTHNDYPPQIRLDQSSPNAAAQPQQPASSIPDVLQPGVRAVRPSSSTASSIPSLAIMQGSSAPPEGHQNPQSQSQAMQSSQHDHQSTSKSTQNTPHPHSRSSPIASPFETISSYNPFNPNTPGGSSSHYVSSPDLGNYGGPGSQRNISNTPLGLADIRPRADSTMSENNTSSSAYELANAQAGTGNYLAPWAIYAFDWCKWTPQGNSAGKMAVGSYLEDGHNFIQILDSHVTPAPQDASSPGSSRFSLEFTKVAEAIHSYPVTRLLWEPPSSQKQSTDLLATSGDHLRLWSLPAEAPAISGNTITRTGREQPTLKLTPLALLSNSKTPDHTAPLTSLDWNHVSPSLIITSSIDTTCTIWDIPSLTAKTQLIAHDKEVYDVRFCANSVDVFVSCGQDGSVRMFDLRSLEHSTIIYEPTGKDEKDGSGRTSPTVAQQTMSNPPPLLRLATSPHDAHLLATFAQDSNLIRILDVRQPGQALLELQGHSGSVNCLEWSPLRRGMLASGGDDCQVLLWDLLNSGSVPGDPGLNGGSRDSQRSLVAAWESDYEVGNIGWVPHLQSPDYGEWLGVSAGRGIWASRVA